MNSFKALFVLCAVLGASSASQYMNHGNRGWDSAASPAGSADAYAQRPGSASFGMMSSAPAGASQAAPAPAAQSSFDSAPAQAATSTVHQVCTCVTLPAAPQAPAFSSTGSAAAPVSHTAEAAPVQQVQQAAPVAQNAYAAPAQQARPQAQTSFNTGKAY